MYTFSLHQLYSQENARKCNQFILLGCCYAMTKSRCKLHSFFFIRMSILWAEAESSYTFFGQYEVGNNPKMFLIINMFCYLIFQSFNSIPTTLCCSTKYLLHLPLLRLFWGAEPKPPCIKRFHCSIVINGIQSILYPLHDMDGQWKY